MAKFHQHPIKISNGKHPSCKLICNDIKTRLTIDIFIQ